MARGKDSEFRLVYSTDQGEICPECGKPRKSCSCEEEKRRTVAGDGNVKVRRETKGRGGKTVTTISGLALTKDELGVLLKDLKRVCGTGGAEKDGILEIQGDRCDTVIAALDKRGIRSKRAGG
jgi:translation initiation factor 1